MKTIGVGVDIVKNKRIQSSLKNRNFIDRTFSKTEILISKKFENKTNYFDAPSVNAIDTTGAGDSFIGTFAYELSESNSPESCIKKAVEKASQSVTKKGTQSSYS